MVCRTDVYGGYYWNPSAASPGNAGGLGAWQQLVTVGSIPPGDPATTFPALNAFSGSLGLYEIQIANAKTTVFYMVWGGYTYRSANRGATWTATNFPQATQANANANQFGNGNDSAFGPRMAVDPNNTNGDVCWVGFRNTALQFTTDGGTTINSVGTGAGGIPISGSSGIFVVFDATSTVTSNRTQTMYAASYGNGVYKSTDAGATWTPLNSAGMPTTFRHMIVDQNGKLWVCADSGSNTLYSYSGGAWTNYVAGSQSSRCWSVVVDPANANNIYVVMDSGDIISSTNGGANWTNPNFNSTRTATDIPWLGATNESYMTAGDIKMFGGKMYFAEGIGVWTTTAPGPTTAWASQSAGIEELVTNWIVSPWIGGSKPVVGFWDRPVFRASYPSSNVYPSGHGINYLQAIDFGWGVDWASSAPGTLAVFTGAGGNAGGGTSTDGGQSWTLWASNPSPTNAGGGAIACSTPLNYVITQSSNGNVFNTKDGGGTWNLVSPPGVPQVGYGTPSVPTASGNNTITFASTPAFLVTGVALGAFYSVQKTGPTPFTISSGSYNPGTGVVTLNMANSGLWLAGDGVNVTLTGSGAGLGSAQGFFTLGSASGSTLTYTIGTGLSITITGGSLTTADFVGTVASTTSTTAVLISGAGGAVNAGDTLFFGTATGYGFSSSQNTQYICADRVLSNTFYLYNDNAAAQGGGIYKSTNSGDTWTKQSSPTFAGGGNAMLRSVPGKASHLFFTGGQGYNTPHPQAYPIYRSIDGGLNWTDANSLAREAWAIGFGAPEGGQTYPTVGFLGWYNGVSGLWQSKDNCVTFQKIAEFTTIGTYDMPVCLEGDANVPGVWYVGYKGSGVARYGP